MDLEKILDMWKKDSVIDAVMLDEASIRIPQLHQKYITLHSEYTLLAKKKRQELRKAEHLKYLYYSGKAPPEDYDEPFPYKVIKSEVASWIAVDAEIQKIELKIDYYETTIRTLEDILKQVHQMSYNIRNSIEWRRFVNGS
tara:strand:- start:330 stop:752 length:423 start_codon:yes stop_codon:yes gene_type:complete